MKYSSIIFTIFLFLISCSKPEAPFVEPEPEPEPQPEVIDSVYAGYNMYFLKDETLNGSDVSNANLKELELQKTPFVSQGNIQYYDTSAHVIYLNESISTPDMVSTLGKPFVVATDTIRHYLGVLWPMISSASYSGPVIDVAPRFYPNDIIKISMGRGTPPSPDMRLNYSIIQTLKDYKVFHAGINCTIDTVEIIENDSVNNSCKLSYTFTIKNNDEFNLYVFDPLIMGDAHFHYYHNGVYFNTNGRIYQSTSGSQAPGEGDNPLNWLTKINSGDSITRTVEKTGYPFIPSSIYDCGFWFDGLNSLGKSSREKPDGMIWIGRRYAKCLITIN